MDNQLATISVPGTSQLVEEHAGVLTNTAAVKKRVDQRDLNSTKVTTSDGIPRNMHTVNESGLYEVIFMSYKPEAREFKRWISHEVLPSIRRHGAYLSLIHI